MTHRFLFTIWLLAASVLLSGCLSTAVQPMTTERAAPGTPSEKRDDLLALPAPNDPIVAAVYRFRDQTGQYKRKERGSTFSRAVTQGGTSILIDALKESGWFVPIERKGLSNLLNERDIIRSTRSQYEGDRAQQLSPLLFAGVMLEGGIIGYNSNVITGGGGVGLFGIRGSGQYRQDQVTIYLRAVSTQTGRVLASVNTKKTIVSQKLDGDAFQFVETDLILETEAGISYNEPSYIAVKEAIDEAVKNLVIEGTEQGAWSPRDTTAMAAVAQRYREAKARAARTDYFGRLTRPEQRSGLGLSVAAGGQRYQGDFQNPEARGAATVGVRWPVATAWEVGLEGTYSRVAATGAFDRRAVTGAAYARYYPLPRGRWTPFVQISGGAQSRLNGDALSSEALSPVVGGDVGMQVMATRRLAVDVSVGLDYALDDTVDGRAVGSYNDSLWGGSLGLTYYDIGALF
jgi:curli production assembly/transport component CsgG